MTKGERIKLLGEVYQKRHIHVLDAGEEQDH